MNDKKPPAPQETYEIEAKREDNSGKQPYASELDDRELEHAHKEKRPVQPQAKATKPR